VNALERRAAELRRQFDSSFSEAVRRDEQRYEDLLAIQVGGDAYAVRLSEVAGVSAERKLTPLPSAQPSLLGLVSFRAAIVPVYDLAALLGYAAPDAGRWLFVAKQAAVAFAFGALDGHERVASSAIVADAQRAAGYQREVADTSSGLRGIVQLSALIETIRNFAAQAASGKRA
jgi:purine-binding chemotaxis protein CheW